MGNYGLNDKENSNVWLLFCIVIDHYKINP